jgi:cytochrome d ubiquinol oxidase subunit II
MTSLSQGYMLGMYVMGLQVTWFTLAFSAVTAVFLTVAYSFIGATWLILKTDEYLQRKAVAWARGGIWGVVLGMGGVSLATPYVSPRIFDKWFSVPEIFLLMPLPLMSGGLILALWLILRRMPFAGDGLAWLPFTLTTALFSLGFLGMAYSFYPYVVPETLTLYESASAPESLFIIFIGMLVVLPMIAGYSVLSYVIFRGKANELRYD